MNKETCVEWCRDNRLLHREVSCPSCYSVMVFSPERNSYGQFRCRRKHRDDKDRVFSITKNTWFDGIRVSIPKAILLTYCFTRQFSYEQALIETSLDEEITSSETIADWYSYCRELTIVGLDRLYEGTGKIGGPGHIVEIDESKIGKRKYNVGRIVEGQWLLGILDLGTLENPTRKYRIEILPNNQRDGETLLRLINRHVEKESTIVTDCWRGYNGLDADGFNHLTVNHTYNFVDPDTFAHTQTIESSWRALKKRILRGGVRKQNLADHLCEYLWRTEMINKKKDFFEGFLEEIRQVFPIRGEPEVIVLD